MRGGLVPMKPQFSQFLLLPSVVAMDVDPKTHSKKRKAPHAGAEVLANDTEAGAFNEDAKARGKAIQSDAAMEFEDDFEDEYDSEDNEDAMQVEEGSDEDPQDDMLPEEEEPVDPQVRLCYPPPFSTSARHYTDLF